MIIQKLNQLPLVALPSQDKELYAFKDRLYIRELSYPDIDGNVSFSEREILYAEIQCINILSVGEELSVFFYVKNSSYKIRECEYRCPVVAYKDEILRLKEYIEKNYIL